MNNLKTLAGVAAAYFLGGSLCLAGEHPKEHPQEHPKEHPKEHPAPPEAKPAPPVGTEDLAGAIEAYVKEEAGDDGITLHDDVDDKDLTLTLVKIHKDKLCKVGEDLYFACADFKEAGGDTYDLDFFLGGTDKDSLKVTEVSVHKKNGKERYGWVEKDGVWKKQPLK